MPTMINAGAVAIDGIIKNNGEKISVNKNNAPIVHAVRPVRPPAAIPAPLSAP